MTTVLLVFWREYLRLYLTNRGLGGVGEDARRPGGTQLWPLCLARPPSVSLSPAGTEHSYAYSAW